MFPSIRTLTPIAGWHRLSLDVFLLLVLRSSFKGTCSRRKGKCKRAGRLFFGILIGELKVVNGGGMNVDGCAEALAACV